MKFPAKNFSEKSLILKEIAAIAKETTTLSFEKDGEELLLTVDLYISEDEIKKLENYLMSNENLKSFSF